MASEATQLLERGAVADALTAEQHNAIWEVQEGYRRDPLAFAREVLRADLWSKQREILLALRDGPRVAVKACHASGKTYAAALGALWWLWNFIPSIVVTTAPTGHQVKDLLWGDIGKLYRRAMWRLGELQKLPRIAIEEDWYAVGLSTRETDHFQGFHSPNILVIVDEASGVEQPIFDAIEGILSTAGDEFPDMGNVRLLLVGNPLFELGAFGDAFRDPGFRKISISAFETPRFTEEEINPRVAAQLTSPLWVEERRHKWGEGSPLWQARVLGEFPSGRREEVAVPLGWLMAAKNRAEDGQAHSGPVQIGLDVARSGANRTALAWRRGQALMEVCSYEQRHTMEVAGLALSKARELHGRFNGPVALNLDLGAMGAGVYDRLREQIGRDASIELHGEHFGARAQDGQTYAMRRDEMYWALRRSAEAGELTWAAQGDAAERAINQLAQIGYTYDSAGRVKVESKEAMRSRGLASPDEADAVALAFAPLDSGAAHPPGWGIGHLMRRFDPGW